MPLLMKKEGDGEAKRANDALAHGKGGSWVIIEEV